MALKNTLDLSQATAALRAWFERTLPSATDIDVSDVHMHADSGISAETIVFDASWTVDGARHERGLVARVQPRTGGVFEPYDLAPEFRLLSALRHTDLPVPEVLWLESDESVLGAPFLIMERVAGQVPRDDPPFTTGGWVLDLPPSRQAELHDNGLRALVELQSLDPAGLGVEFLAEAGVMSAPTLAATIGRWRRFFEYSSAGKPHDTLEYAYQWLEDHQPPEPTHKVISWGDARPGNMIFADDLSVAAVIDWELAAIAAPETDLAWWLILMRHHTEGIGAPMPPGFPDREATLDRYRELSGHQPEHLEFYEVLAATRFATCMVRAANMMIAAGQLPPDAPMAYTNPGAQLLAQLLGLPTHTGERQTFIGNRS